MALKYFIKPLAKENNIKEKVNFGGCITHTIIIHGLSHTHAIKGGKITDGEIVRRRKLK